MDPARVSDFIARHWELVAVFVVLLVALGASELWRLLGGQKRIEPQEAIRLINREDALMLDVRQAAEYKKSHIINARNMPQEKLDEEAGRLSSEGDRPIIAYCNTGANAQRAAARLARAGHGRVYILKGGIQAWKSAGMPLEGK
ncbi:MAG TPA: rhodanese-like domain-containing protein [Gammaproteobacteria bacterium]|nr:rhodanese-like domain-containing protein [Gammaproteobacteria bacterium]